MRVEEPAGKTQRDGAADAAAAAGYDGNFPVSEKLALTDLGSLTERLRASRE